jgi:hypothetical protein
MSLVSWAICAGAQRDAGAQAVFLGEGHARIHQCDVLVFVAVVAIEEAIARELCDLLADELLLVEAIAQALEDVVRVLAEVVQQVVAAEPVAVVRKAWVGLDQIAATAGVDMPKRLVVGIVVLGRLVRTTSGMVLVPPVPEAPSAPPAPLAADFRRF